MTTTTFGQFLEFSVPAKDVQESLSFYHKLGFSELSVGDIRNYHYGVVTDGHIAIGLHADGIEEPALTFVKSDVASYLQHVSPGGEELFFSRVGSEDFHEIGVHTPDGHLLIMIEARTFSQVRLSELPTPITGRSVEISLGCRDLDDAARYWTDAGFMANSDTENDVPGDRVEMLVAGLCLGLRTDRAAGKTALRFMPDDFGQVLDHFEKTAIAVTRTSDGCQVTAPEGTQLDIVNAAG